MAVDFTNKEAFVASPPRLVMADPYDNTQGSSHTGYDVLPDGRFLMIGKPAATVGPITHLRILYKP